MKEPVSPITIGGIVEEADAVSFMDMAGLDNPCDMFAVLDTGGRFVVEYSEALAEMCREMGLPYSAEIQASGSEDRRSLKWEPGMDAVSETRFDSGGIPFVGIEVVSRIYRMMGTDVEAAKEALANELVKVRRPVIPPLIIKGFLENPVPEVIREATLALNKLDRGTDPLAVSKLRRALSEITSGMTNLNLTHFSIDYKGADKICTD